MVVCSHNDRRKPLQETKKRTPRKTEPCGYCGGRHFSENARLRCLKAAEKNECTCPRYWRARWLSHCGDCKCETPRAAVEPYTEEEIAEREARASRAAFKNLTRRKQ